MNTSLRSLIGIAAAFLSSGALSQAALTLYTDRAAFMTAVNSSIYGTLDYEDVDVGTDGQMAASNYSEEGVSITGLQTILSPAFASGLYSTGSGQNANTGPGGTATVTIPVSFRAAGFDLFTVGPSGNHAGTTVTVATSAGDMFTIDTTGLVNGEDMFVGFVSSGDITSFTITPASGSSDDRRYANTDNIAISTVPEPSVAMMSAIVGFGLCLRRRR